MIHPTERGLVACDDGHYRPAWARQDPERTYYDREWGVPVTDERRVFERLCLECLQCGLSWRTILLRRPALCRALADFSPDAVAAFSDADIERLMNDPTIIRNRAKLRALVDNAKATLALREEGGLSALVWSFAPETHTRPGHVDDIPSHTEASRALAKELKKHGFRFVGPTTMYAAMQAIGVVDDHVIGAYSPLETATETGETPSR